MFNELQKAEVMKFEYMVMGNIKALIPEGWHKFVLKQKFIVNKFDQFEEFIQPFLTEEGLVDGESLNGVLEVKFPTATKYVSLPQEEFSLCDVASELMGMFFGGIV